MMLIYWSESARMAQPNHGDEDLLSAEAKGLSVADLLKDLKRYFTENMADDTSVVAAYIFGSCARDLAADESDLDLAFLVDHRAYNSNPLRTVSSAFMIATKIGMRFDKETDVTILNGSSIEMAYEVVTTGKCIYQADSETRLEYEAKVRGMYFDFRPFLMELRSRSLAKL
jgi:predicted nucleotidyltransferase